MKMDRSENPGERLEFTNFEANEKINGGTTPGYAWKQDWLTEQVCSPHALKFGPFDCSVPRNPGRNTDSRPFFVTNTKPTPSEVGNARQAVIRWCNCELEPTPWCVYASLFVSCPGPLPPGVSRTVRRAPDQMGWSVTVESAGSQTTPAVRWNLPGG